LSALDVVGLWVHAGSATVAHQAGTGLPCCGNADLLATMGALGKEHQGVALGCRGTLSNFRIAHAVDSGAEHQSALGILLYVAEKLAAETSALAVLHAHVDAILPVGVAEGFPVLGLAAQVCNIMPLHFGFLETEHAAEAPVPANKTAVFVRFETSQFDGILFDGNHFVPPDF